MIQTHVLYGMPLGDMRHLVTENGGEKLVLLDELDEPREDEQLLGRQRERVDLGLSATERGGYVRGGIEKVRRDMHGRAVRTRNKELTKSTT